MQAASERLSAEFQVCGSVRKTVVVFTRSLQCYSSMLFHAQDWHLVTNYCRQVEMWQHAVCARLEGMHDSGGASAVCFSMAQRLDIGGLGTLSCRDDKIVVLYCACCSHELLLLTQKCRMNLVWASHAMAVVHLHLATCLQLSRHVWWVDFENPSCKQVMPA